ncbi:MAG: class I SAM-dependent methyltransferase [Halobacteriovoraceae bacterium]|nr:class I SAM-dependent methyltransferase [Halobacteriovoraceae bacterium]MCB9095197.1 class I SAM-dependent methyltransferase [Halobacteriovoraceae bacterium]
MMENINQLKEKHNQYSQAYPLQNLSEGEMAIYKKLEEFREKLRFPAIKNDIGSFFNYLIQENNYRYIFEFGSGYGHSCFWYFVGGNEERLKSVILTEIRDDLEEYYLKNEFPNSWREKIQYSVGDSFEIIQELKPPIDFLLIDGQKALYREFIEIAWDHLSGGATIAIDNAFFKGSLLEDGLASAKATAAIRDLHQWVHEGEKNKRWKSCYFPYADGLILLNKTIY